MSKYILITFYPIDRDNHRRVWVVYGHIAPGVNEEIGEYPQENEAIKKSFAYGLPVMLGRNYDDVLNKLVAEGTL